MTELSQIRSKEVQQSPDSAMRRRSTCRACDGSQLQPFLKLGPTPLANSFLSTPDEFADEPSFPLDVYFCCGCSLVQLLDVVDPEILFRNYIYVTGTADSIVGHNRDYAREVSNILDLSIGDLVIEAASNNGNLLKCFRDLDRGIRCLGIEPAENIALMANESGIETVNDFFNLETADAIRVNYGKARAVIGNNVLAHVDDPKDFLAGCRSLIGEDGLVIIEVPYIREFVERVEFDTVYHEHLCYFSINSLMRLFGSVGLSIVRIDHVTVHGGSVRIFAGLCEKFAQHAEEVRRLADDERSAGFTSFEIFDDLARRVTQLRSELRSLLESIKARGETVAAYGAPAKGNTLLNYCGIGTDLVSFAVDKNPLKVGKFMPGSHIPVFPVSEVVKKQPDHLLILAWNFADEIMDQQQEYFSRGGKFIIPIPKPVVVER